jgi:hypothetical protein
MDFQNDDSQVYAITVGDIRGVAEEEGFEFLTDEEIKKIADRVGDYIGWHDSVLMALNDCLPEHRRKKQQQDED